MIKKISTSYEFKWKSNRYKFYMEDDTVAIIDVPDYIAVVKDEDYLKGYLAKAIAGLYYDKIHKAVSADLDKVFGNKEVEVSELYHKGGYISPSYSVAENSSGFAAIAEAFGEPLEYCDPPESPVYFAHNKLPKETQEAVLSCPACHAKLHLWSLGIHLNDQHDWTREAIADWLETLDMDLEFKNNDK